MIELLRARRSIRKYENRSIENDKIEVLKEAALRAPSSRNFTPWEFIFVEDKALLEGLSKSKPHGAGFIKNAALGVVICADENKADTWVEDCAIATILLQLAAQSIGLGSCWIQIRLREHAAGGTAEAYIQNLLGLPQNLRVESMVAVGYPAEKRAGLAKEQLQFAKISRNRYGERY